MKRTARISADGLYRYELWRDWSGYNTRAAKSPLVAILLNPSTADGERDDPTNNKLVKYARREGHDGLWMGNVLAYRATDPRWLSSVEDPVGTENYTTLTILICQAHKHVLVGWGTQPHLREKMKPVIEHIKAMAKFHNKSLVCLGKNNDGSPKHPLYLRDDAPLVAWP